MSVVVAGSINVDLHLRLQRHPLPGETLLASGGDLSPGGKGANQACAAALAGAEVALLGAVGDDDAHQSALSLLRSAGVDLSHLIQVPGPTGLAVVSVDALGENTVVVVPGANAGITTQTVDSWEALLAAAPIVVSQGELSRAATERIARLTRNRWLLNLAPVIELDPEVIRMANPLVVNEHEAQAALLQLGGPAVDQPEALVAKLRAQGLASVVLTLGAAGALISDDNGTHHVPSPKVTAVDTVGAGDAFTGALAARLADGTDLLEAARHAVRFAAHTVQFEGAQASYPAPGTALPTA
ncbi:MAG: ribokinase [Propionibacteriaceae bacterium]|nr:ribokinase [Propionibacteriaceae bacterium]